MFLYDFAGFVIIYYIRRHINKSHAEKIANAATAREAFLIRRELKSARKKLAFVCAGIFTVIYFIEFSVEYKGDTEKATIAALIVFIFSLVMILVSPSYRKAVNGVSVYTPKEYQKDFPQYALYLRPFYMDEYSERGTHLPTRTENGRDIGFSEQLFVAELEKKIAVCAVGMTKEVEHPVGATRVYVDDETWQEDVLDLMSKAESIYILVDNRDSCLWEIEQSKAFMDKTTYIITDVAKYQAVRQSLKVDIPLPAIDGGVTDDIQLVVSFKDGQAQIQELKNSVTGYHQLLNIEEGVDRVIGITSPYSGFEHIQILAPSADPNGDLLREEVAKLCEEKQRQCPIMLGDFLTLAGCQLDGDTIRFVFSMNEECGDMDVLKEQRQQLEETTKAELQEYSLFWQSVEKLHLQIEHLYTGNKTGQQLRFVY